jgi:hypothetical protein
MIIIYSCISGFMAALIAAKNNRVSFGSAEVRFAVAELAG